ncbi:unnamed protein product [Urochloa humidicola]
MAEIPAATPEYERRRRENILRNNAILAPAPPRRCRHPRPLRPRPLQEAPPPAPAEPRRSGRARIQPPRPSSAAAIRSARLKPYAANLPISDAFVPKVVADASAPLTSAILAASCPPEGGVRAEDAGFEPGEELVLRPQNVRKLVLRPQIAVARVLPLADRTVVAAGTVQGHLVFWDADGPVPKP